MNLTESSMMEYFAARLPSPEAPGLPEPRHGLPAGAGAGKGLPRAAPVMGPAPVREPLAGLEPAWPEPGPREGASCGPGAGLARARTP
jgi:hypothetical protein